MTRVPRAGRIYRRMAERGVRGAQGLKVWERGMELVVECYALAKRLPVDERFGLASQIRRAAVSVPANIAEGHARDALGDYLNHLAIAAGSLSEVETLLIVLERLDLVTPQQLSRPLSLAAETSRMLASLRRAIRARRRATAP